MKLLLKASLAASVALWAGAAGAVILDADADAFVEGARFANTVNGNNPLLAASYDRFGTRSFKTYIRFDLDGHDGEKSNAVLSMTKASTFPHNIPAVPYLLYAMKDAEGDGWIEAGPDGITFNTAPTNNTSDYFDMSGATFLGDWSVPIGPPEGTVESFDAPSLTTFLNEGAGDDGLITLILLNSQCCYESFASREHFDSPFRTEDPGYPGPSLSFDVLDPEPPVPSVPLPAALPLSLASLGALGWLARRRSRI